MRQTASVSLVYDGGYYIIFDSPSATDLEAKAQMLRGIGDGEQILFEPRAETVDLTTFCRPDSTGYRARTGPDGRQQPWASGPFRSGQLFPERTTLLRSL